MRKLKLKKIELTLKFMREVLYDAHMKVNSYVNHMNVIE